MPKLIVHDREVHQRETLNLSISDFIGLSRSFFEQLAGLRKLPIIKFDVALIEDGSCKVVRLIQRGNQRTRSVDVASRLGEMHAALYPLSVAQAQERLSLPTRKTVRSVPFNGQRGFFFSQRVIIESGVQRT